LNAKYNILKTKYNIPKTKCNITKQFLLTLISRILCKNAVFYISQQKRLQF